MCTSCDLPKFDFSQLRGLIRSKIGTEGEFARLINRTPQFVSSVLNGNTYFTVSDIYNSCNVLDIETDKIGVFFYTQKIHKSEQEGE